MNDVLFRSANLHDLHAIHHLALDSGIGMTSLVKNNDLLEKRLLWAVKSFSSTISKPHHEYYLFVLEDTSTHKLVGISAIQSNIGNKIPFYSYRLTKHIQRCASLDIQNEYNVLTLIKNHKGCSEMCSLFLEPPYRHGGNGLLLSRSRFLFMANYPNRFEPTVIAEMRGVSDESGHSPFWDAVGHHFFHMTYAKADKLTPIGDKQFISDLMPTTPILVELLPPSAQAVIGKPHPDTEAALTMLINEGFQLTDYVDIFDAGPTISVSRKKIKTIRDSQLLTIDSLVDDVHGSRYIVANTNLQFRATISQITFQNKKTHCAIHKDTADLLQIKVGDCVRVALL